MCNLKSIYYLNGYRNEWIASTSCEDKPLYVLDDSFKQRMLEKKVFIDEDIIRKNNESQ